MYKTKAQYIGAMKHCKQFAHFGVEPQWDPARPDINGFIHDEVVRQWHDPNVLYDGGIRINKMWNAWSWAHTRCLETNDGLPTTDDIITLGRYIEDINAEGTRHFDLTAGMSIGAPFKLVHTMLAMLVGNLERVDRSVINDLTVPNLKEPGSLWAVWMPEEEVYDRWTQFIEKIQTVDDAYLAFELLHPFGDGNGRSGKILANWLANRLDNPWLPPDYFGNGVP